MNNVATVFALGDLIDVTPVARGAMGRVSRITTSTGVYAVKELFWPTEEVAVRREVALCEAAVRAGLLAPRCLATTDGRYLHDAVRVFDWVSGRAVTADERGRAEWAGHALGTIHALRMTGADPDSWSSTSPTPERWSELLDRGTDQPWASPLRAALPQLRDLAGLVLPADPARLVLSHGDIQPANVLVNDTGFHLLDWENAGPLDPNRELASLLHTWSARDGVVDVHAVAETMAAYRAAGGHGVVRDLSAFAGLVAAYLNYIAEQASVSIDHDEPEMRAHATAEACAFLADPPSLQCFEQILKAAS